MMLVANGRQITGESFLALDIFISKIMGTLYVISRNELYYTQHTFNSPYSLLEINENLITASEKIFIFKIILPWKSSGLQVDHFRLGKCHEILSNSPVCWSMYLYCKLVLRNHEQN